MKLKTMASAMPFAHLLGLGAVAAHAAQEDTDREQRADESDDDYAKRMEEKDKEDAAKKAEQDKKDEDARRAEQQDDEDEKDEKDEGKRAARARERVRCAAIVSAGMKAGVTKQACVFAFDTSLTATQAIAALGAASLDAPAASAPARPRGLSLDERMSHVPKPAPGASAPAAQQPSLAEQIIAAGKKRRGEAA